MRRKIAIGRLSFPRRREGEVFWYKSPHMLSTPHLPPSLGYGAAGSPLPLRKGRGGRDRRSSHARWNPKADNVKHRKAFGIEE